jgi:hypothetical protein
VFRKFNNQSFWDEKQIVTSEETWRRVEGGSGKWRLADSALEAYAVMEFVI